MFVSVSPLAQRFQAARDKAGLSNRQIAIAAGVSAPTVDRLMKGDVDTKPANLDAIATVVGVPIAEARELAGMPPVNGGPYAAPDESRLLDKRQRAALDELIRSMVSPRSLDEADEGTGLGRVETHFARDGVGIKRADNRDQKRR